MMLFDTDVCIELLRGNKQVITKREKEKDEVAISFISVGELFYGAYKSNRIQNNIILVEKFLLTVKIIQSDHDIMKKFGELKSKLVMNKVILPDADLLIASTTISKCNKLITGNLNHFRRIDELKIENWIQ